MDLVPTSIYLNYGMYGPVNYHENKVIMRFHIQKWLRIITVWG